jgi:hypothetical protein
MLDEPPRVRDGPIITPTVAKSIVGQAGLQLTVMAALLGPMGEALTHHTTAAADAATAVAGAGAAVADAAVAAAAAAVAVGVDGAAAVGGAGVDRVEQYTLVFNSFVMMQLFNQVRLCCCYAGAAVMFVASRGRVQRAHGHLHHMCSMFGLGLQLCVQS